MRAKEAQIYFLEVRKNEYYIFNTCWVIKEFAKMWWFPPPSFPWYGSIWTVRKKPKLSFFRKFMIWHICFSGTFLFLPYSHTLLISLSLTTPSTSLFLSFFNSLPLSLTHSLPHLSLSLILSSSLSLSLPALSLFLSLRFFPPFPFFPFKTIQPL